MKGRIRIATVGVMVAMMVTAMTSSAGASSVSTWNVGANGGFISLSLLHAIGLTGGTSEADATSAPSAEAFGDGLCVSLAESTNPCPTKPGDATGQALGYSQSAVQTGANGSAVPSPGSASGNCLVPVTNVLVVTLSAACGIASASEDDAGNPTATGTGYLANLSVGLSLGDLLGTNNLGSLPLVGSLCPSGTAPAASSTGTTGTTPAAGTPLAGLLGTVNTLLGGAGLSSLLGTSVASGSSPLAPVCSILNGLVSELTGAAGVSNLLNLNANTNIITINVGRSDSTVTTSGSVVTAEATQKSVDINLLGLLDIQVTPTSATVSVDRSTGIATPSFTNGVLQVTQGTGVPTIVTLPVVSNLLDSLLSSLNVSGLLDGLVGPDFNVLGGSTTGAGTTSATATSGILDLSLLNGLVALNFGDATARGSSTSATPGPVTEASVTPNAPAAVVPTVPAAVPNVTTVHTGEFWAGTLPIILLSGMGLAGITLVGRRRFIEVARTLSQRSGKTRP
jgi:hypothetical protein